MDDRGNTIAGWVLAGGIAALGLSIATGMYFHAERPEKMGYVVEGVVEEGAGAEEAAQPIEFYLAKADPVAGEQAFKKCAACHNADKGGPNALGPNLWGSMGKPHGHVPGFAYTDALKSKPGVWDWTSMSEWLANPKKYAPGTKMTFAGLSKPEERANVIAYLNRQSDSPLPLPAAPTADPAAEVATGATTAQKAENEPVLTEAQATANPEASVSHEGAPKVSGTSKQER